MGTAAERWKQKEMGEKLQQRTKESYDRKDEYGPSFTYFRKDLKDVSVWRPKEGLHVFDIIPSFAGSNWPMDNHGGNLAEGEPVYVLDIQVHQNVGPNDAQFVCLGRNFGGKCPICEHQAELKKQIDYDQDLIKTLYPKRRNMYNVICYDNADEEDKGVQVFEVAHFFMESKLTPLAMDARTKALIPYAHYDKGKTVQFEVKKKTFTINEKSVPGFEYIGHKFLDRNYSLADPWYDDGTSLLDMAFTLDELIYIPTYEEVYEAYWAGIKELPPEEQPQGQSTAGGRRRPRPAQPEEEKPVAEQPTSGRQRRSKAKITAASSEPVPLGTCPLGGKFGEDIDQLEGCNTCAPYDSCALRAEELKQKEGRASLPATQGGEDIAATAGGGKRLRRRPGAGAQ